VRAPVATVAAGAFSCFRAGITTEAARVSLGLSSSWVPAFQADFRKEEGVTDLTRFRRKINLPVVVSQADLSA
jgi:hypothetical protein